MTKLGCPKRMVFGPCGGVRPDGQCEMSSHRCSFDNVIPWSGKQAAPQPVRAPLVLADFSATAFDSRDITRTAAVMSTGCHAVLVGEHQNKPDFPPTLMGSMLLSAGVTPWVTLSCRDRNRVVLEQELRGLQSIGVQTVLCVTGDGRGYDVRPEVTQTFDLDGPRLISLAATLGVTAAAPETPTAPPTHARPRRLVEKQRAGASVAVLNHVSETFIVSNFIKTARAQGLSIPVIAAVTVFTDRGSAAVLEGLPGLQLDPAITADVLESDDPVAAGIDAAVNEAQELLAIDGVSGVNLSGLASAANPYMAAEIKAEAGRQVLAGVE